MSATKVAQRRSAAEEVCWTLVLMMELGLLELPMKNREMLSEPMQKWSSLCVETAVMKP